MIVSQCPPRHRCTPTRCPRGVGPLVYNALPLVWAVPAKSWMLLAIPASRSLLCSVRRFPLTMP